MDFRLGMYMYVCPNCQSSYSRAATSKTLYCPDCRAPLIDMNISKEKYKALSEQERIAYKENILNKRETVRQSQKTALDTMRMGEKRDQRYEYKVDILYDNPDGTFNLKELDEKLNDYAAYGWELQQIYNNELGKMIMIERSWDGGVRNTNSTVCSHVLIFRREKEEATEEGY